jgi:hypothetical protein
MGYGRFKQKISGAPSPVVQTVSTAPSLRHSHHALHDPSSIRPTEIFIAHIPDFEKQLHIKNFSAVARTSLEITQRA